MWLHLESVLQSGTGAQLVLPLRHQNTAICAPQHVTAAAWRPSRCVKRQHRRHILQPLLALQVEAPTSPLAVEDAWQLLEEFSAKEMRGLAQQFLDSAEKRRLLRDALLVSANPSFTLAANAATQNTCARGCPCLLPIRCSPFTPHAVYFVRRWQPVHRMCRQAGALMRRRRQRCCWE